SVGADQDLPLQRGSPAQGSRISFTPLVHRGSRKTLTVSGRSGATTPASRARLEPPRCHRSFPQIVAKPSLEGVAAVEIPVGRNVVGPVVVVIHGGVVTAVVGVDVGSAERALRPPEIGAPIGIAEQSLWPRFVVDARNISFCRPS